MEKIGAKEKIEVVESNKMIDLVALAKNEPELFDELAADYPAEKSIYVFCIGE